MIVLRVRYEIRHTFSTDKGITNSKTHTTCMAAMLITDDFVNLQGIQDHLLVKQLIIGIGTDD
jgi:hypothetical protein